MIRPVAGRQQDESIEIDLALPSHEAAKLHAEIYDNLPQILGRGRMADAALVRTVIDLAAGKRWCDASTAEIADRAGVSKRHAERRIPFMVKEARLTDLSVSIRNSRQRLIFRPGCSPRTGTNWRPNIGGKIRSCFWFILAF